SAVVLTLFFFDRPATSYNSPLSLHDALPICVRSILITHGHRDHHENVDQLKPLLNAPVAIGIDDAAQLSVQPDALIVDQQTFNLDRKSTRLNSSHVAISYAVFCL